MKCMPITRSGRPEADAIFVIEIDDVFDARIASSLQTSPRLLKIASLISSFSGAASIDDIAIEQIAVTAAGLEVRSSSRRVTRPSSLPFSTSRSSCFLIFADALLREIGRGIDDR